MCGRARTKPVPKLLSWKRSHEVSHRHPREDEGLRQLNVGPQRSAIRRLDKAFKSFFGRAKAGEKLGFPRFKARHGGIRSFDISAPFIRDGSLRVKGEGRFRLPSSPPSKPCPPSTSTGDLSGGRSGTGHWPHLRVAGPADVGPLIMAGKPVQDQASCKFGAPKKAKGQNRL